MMSQELPSEALTNQESISIEKIEVGQAEEIKKLARLLYVFGNKRTDFLEGEPLIINIAGNLSGFNLSEDSILKIDPLDAGNTIRLGIVVGNGFQDGGLERRIFMASTEINVKQAFAKHRAVGAFDDLGPELQLGVNKWLSVLRELKAQTVDNRINNPVV